MTNFIYNMQDELFNLNMILPVGEFSPIKKLVDHIEAQGKQLRELNMTIENKNKTIENYEREKESWRRANSTLFKKVQELEEGIRDSEDLTWKQKYEALLHSSEQAIGALQKKCQEYKNSESDAITSTIETLTKVNIELKEKNKKLEERRDGLKRMCEDIMVEKNAIIHKLEEDKKVIEKNFEYEQQINKNLNTIINSKNKLLDEYMTKCNNLEHNYKEEVRMKEQFKMTCFKHEKLQTELEKAEQENKTLINKYERLKTRLSKICDIIHGEE